MGDLSDEGTAGYQKICRCENNGKGSGTGPAIFEKLQLDILVSEPDEHLNSREDLLSSLDGLHEDIYFVGTDYFKNYGMEKAGQVTDAPGADTAKIRKHAGKPQMKVTLYSQRAPEPVIELPDGTMIRPEIPKEDMNVWMKSIRKEGNGKTSCTVGGRSARKGVEAYVSLLDEGKLALAGKLEGVTKIIFETPERDYGAKVLQGTRQQEQSLDICEIDLSEKSVIGYDDYSVS